MQLQPLCRQTRSWTLGEHNPWNMLMSRPVLADAAPQAAGDSNRVRCAQETEWGCPPEWPDDAAPHAAEVTIGSAARRSRAARRGGPTTAAPQAAEVTIGAAAGKSRSLAARRSGPTTHHRLHELQ